MQRALLAAGRFRSSLLAALLAFAAAKLARAQRAGAQGDGAGSAAVPCSAMASSRRFSASMASQGAYTASPGGKKLCFALAKPTTSEDQIR